MEAIVQVHPLKKATQLTDHELVIMAMVMVFRMQRYGGV